MNKFFRNIYLLLRYRNRHTVELFKFLDLLEDTPGVSKNMYMSRYAYHKTITGTLYLVYGRIKNKNIQAYEMYSFKVIEIQYFSRDESIVIPEIFIS